MIQHVRIQNFKCLKDSEFNFRNMTVLCGQNGVGKSSLIHAILLLRQLIADSSGSAIVQLNGPFNLELGEVGDVFCSDAIGDTIAFTLSCKAQNSCCVTFPISAYSRDQQFLQAESVPEQCPRCLESQETSAFVFLSAERHGPQDTHLTQSKPLEQIQVGTCGEFTAELLHKFERDAVRQELWHPKSVEGGTFFRQQVELWMSEIVPDIEIRPESFPGTNIVALSLKRGGMKGEWNRPSNMGFGISYVLPIIVAGLLAKPESLFIVDSPEAHLHPAGQAHVARFLAHLAGSGVQVIVETHSDHIVNGIRLAALDSCPFERDQLIIHSFAQDEDGNFTTSPISVTSTGSLSSWPKGFFDQSEKDLAAIIKASRKNG